MRRLQSKVGATGIVHPPAPKPHRTIAPCDPTAPHRFIPTSLVVAKRLPVQLDTPRGMNNATHAI